MPKEDEVWEIWGFDNFSDDYHERVKTREWNIIYPMYSKSICGNTRNNLNKCYEALCESILFSFRLK